MRTLEGPILTFALNALWQVPLVVILALLVDRLVRGAPARHRHAFWLAAAAIAVLLPLASVRGPVRSISPRPAAGTSPAPAPGSEASGLGWIPTGGARQATVPIGAGSAIALLYGLSLVFHGWRLGRSWRRANRLVSNARRAAIPAHLAPAVERCRQVFGASGIALLGSPDVGVPATVGAWPPVILLPCRFFEHATADETLAALGHELAHVRRRDYAVHLLCEILLLPVAFHPAVRMVRRRLAEAREMACDEAVVETAVGPRTYARSLLSLAATAAGLPRPSTTLGVLDAHTLEVRMRRILDVAPRMSAPRARASLGAALLLLIGIAAAASGYAVQAVAKGSPAGGLGPFVGTWSGDWPPNDKNKREENLRALDLEVRPDGQILTTWYRYKKTAAGPTLVDKEIRPATSFEISGSTLIVKARVDDFKLRDRAPAAAEFVESLELQGRNEGVFRVLSNSYLTALKQRGEPVPPPPPPIAMKRVS